jgi:uncharacterized membrane protein YkoI
VTDKLKKLLMGLAALTALAAGGSAIAGAASNSPATEASEPAEAPGTENAADDKGEAADKALTGTEAQRAKDAALAETGGGTVGDVEGDTENGASYAVEVTKADGSKVDVRLDSAYKVLGVEADDHGDQSEKGEGPEAGQTK